MKESQFIYNVKKICLFIVLFALPVYALSISLSSLMHVVFLLTGLIIIVYYKKTIMIPNWFVIGMMILINLIIVSMFFSINPIIKTIMSSAIYIINLLTSIICYLVLKNKDQLFSFEKFNFRKLRAISVYFSGIALLISGFYCFYIYALKSYPYLNRNGGFIGMPVTAAAAFLLLSWIVLYLSFYVNKKNEKVILRVGFFGGFLGVLGTGTRVSILLFMIGLFIIMFFLFKLKVKYKIAITLLILLLFILIMFVHKDNVYIARFLKMPKTINAFFDYFIPFNFDITPVDRNKEPYVRNIHRSRYWIKEKLMHGENFTDGDIIRPILWKMTCIVIKERPIIGYGVGSWYKFMYITTNYAIIFLDYNPKHRFTHPHNDLILFASEIGIPFVIIYLIIFGTIIIRFFKAFFKRLLKPYDIILIVALIVYFLSSMSDVITFNVKISGVFFCLLAYLAHLGEYVKNKKKNDENLFYITL